MHGEFSVNPQQLNAAAEVLRQLSQDSRPTPQLTEETANTADGADIGKSEGAAKFAAAMRDQQDCYRLAMDQTSQTVATMSETLDYSADQFRAADEKVAQLAAQILKAMN